LIIDFLTRLISCLLKLVEQSIEYFPKVKTNPYYKFYNFYIALNVFNKNYIFYNVLYEKPQSYS